MGRLNAFALLLILSGSLAMAAGQPTEDDPAAELIRMQQQQAKAYGDLNVSNPLSAAYNPNAVVPTTGPAAQFQRLLANPMVAAQLKFVSSPVVAEGVKKIAQHPNRMILLYSQIGWIVFMLFFKAWRLAQSSKWYVKIWTRLWTLGLFWIGSLGVIPCLVLGDEYKKLLSAVFDIYMKK